jgi:hypothetical protein
VNRLGILLTVVLWTGCAEGDDPVETPAVATDPAATTEAVTTADDAAQQHDAPAVSLPGWPEAASPAIKALYAGSWAPDGPEGFDEQWIDEAGLVETYTKRRAGRRMWRGLRSSDGVLPVDVLIRDREGPLVTYLYVLNYRRPDDPFADFGEFDYEDEAAVLHLRYRGRARVLFDGKLIIDVPAPPAGEVGEARAAVTLTDGFDVVLVKLGRGSDELGWSLDCELRLSDEQGDAIERQGWNTMRASDVPSELAAKPDVATETDPPPR